MIAIKEIGKYYSKLVIVGKIFMIDEDSIGLSLEK